jgi:putative Mg2+ transporter-C (MgtC) family protein
MDDLQWYFVASGRLILAALCGGLIGYEREVREKGAGLRTHMLICMGACMYSLVGVSMYKQYPTGDPLRVVQGLLLGVGFIAGGVIFTQRGSVHGLTTAAGLWVLTAIGLAAGFGYYFLTGVGTFLAVAVIIWLGRIERERIRKHPREQPEEEPSSD